MNSTHERNGNAVARFPNDPMPNADAYTDCISKSKSKVNRPVTGEQIRDKERFHFNHYMNQFYLLTTLIKTETENERENSSTFIT